MDGVAQRSTSGQPPACFEHGSAQQADGPRGREQTVVVAQTVGGAGVVKAVVPLVALGERHPFSHFGLDARIERRRRPRGRARPASL